MRELEDLVISAIYAGLIEGTLDPYNQVVRVSSISPLRDLPPDSIPAMLSTLSEWSERCTSTLAHLEEQIAAIKTEAARRAKEEREWTAHVEKLMEVKDDASSKDAAAAKASGGLFSGLGKRLQGVGGAKRENEEEGGDMDVDEEEEEDPNKRATRSSKKRGFGFGSK